MKNMQRRTILESHDQWAEYSCHKPSRDVLYKGNYVPYNGTYGASDQGQTLDARRVREPDC